MSNTYKRSGKAGRRCRWALPLMMAWIVFAQAVPVFEFDALADCGLSLSDTSITDNGDGDGVADTNETLRIGLSLLPYCDSVYDDERLSGCVALLSTESPTIDCIRDAEIQIGLAPKAGPAVEPADRFEVKVGSVDRHDLGLGPDAALEAVLQVDIRCMAGPHEYWQHETLTLPLDLNVVDQGQTPIAWIEDFEASGNNPEDPLLGSAFHAENLDAGLPGHDNVEGLWLSQGWRCQYSDPDWRNAAAYNHEQGLTCYPGMNLAQANAIFWQVDGSLIPDSPDGGRAHRGEKSMYYGIFMDHIDELFTTPMSTVESTATRDLINLGAESPELSFWQQVSLADERMINTGPGHSVDRGVVQILLHDSAGIPVSDWTTLHPIQNPYAQQAENNYFNCMFDPTDDGNDEDDYFDPTNPSRKFGPSSSCYPAFSWAFMGSTTGAFSVEEIGYATTPPAASDAPSLGQGTWVEAKIDLSDFRGRRAKLRFLVTSLKGSELTYFDNHWPWGPQPDERDDGWWIDDIVIDETLTEPAVFVNDRFVLGSCSGTGEPCIGQCRSNLAPCSDAVPCGAGEGDCVIPCPAGEICAGPPPECGANCAEAQVNLFVEPAGPLNPEGVTRSEVSDLLTVNFAAPLGSAAGAQPSWVDACIDGHKEYRACISGDPDGDLSGSPDTDCDDPWDSPICESCTLDWGLNSAMTPSQDVVTTYAVEVRCSSAPYCRDGRTIEIRVECAFGQQNTFGLRELRALDRDTLTWNGPLDVDWLRGSFVNGTGIGNYVADFTDTASHATSVPMSGEPAPNTGYYYLVKADGPATGSNSYYCGTKTWRSGGVSEMHEPARNAAFGDP